MNGKVLKVNTKSTIKQAVILAAGERQDFDRPATFLEIEETIIIERLIEILKNNGIDKIVIVTGYQKHYFDNLNVKEVELVESDRFKWTGTMYSLSLVKEHINDDFLLVEGDLIFEEKAIDYLLQSDNENCLVLANESGSGDEELVEVRDGRVFRISKDMHQLGKIDGEFIGLSRIDIKTYQDMLVDFEGSENPYLHYEYVLMNLKGKYNIGYTKIDDLVWSELDTQEDYENLKLQIYPRLKKKEAEFRENHVKKVFFDIMGDNYNIKGNIEKLGGMNNGNYRVNTDRGDFVLRIAGKGAQQTVNRDSELFNTTIAHEIGIDCNTIYFDTESGIKITEYIEDAETLNVATAKREDNMKLMADTLNILHKSGKKFFRDFQPFEEMEDYINKVISENKALLKDYVKLEFLVNYCKDETENMEIECLPCHLDAWPENFIKGKDKVYLIDWEYSCNYDKLWDVASIGLECEYSKDETELFYNKYFGRKPTEKEIKKMDVLRILMDIYWSMWSLSETSLGEDLYDYSFGRYSRAVANFNALHNDKCHEE